MKLLVTGAAGFIGRHLIPRLIDRYDVITVTRTMPALEFLEVEPIPIDLACPIDLSVLPRDVEIIIHMAQARASFPEGANELLAVNTVSTQYLLDYARGIGARRFILISSGDVYAGSVERSRENDPVAPTSYYGATKLAAEALTQAYAGCFQVCILRLFHPYGPTQTDRLIPKLTERIKRGQPIRVSKDCRPRFTPTYVDDVVTAIERAIGSSYSGIINVTGDAVVSIRQLAEEIGATLMREPIFENTDELTRDWMGENTLMKQVLGAWPLIALGDGLRRTLDEGKSK